MTVDPCVGANVDPAALFEALDANWGLPARFYADPEICRLDVAAIFRRHWQYLCPTARVAKPGDVAVGFAGDVPVVVTRGEDGALRGFVNMCRHRGYRLAESDRKNCNRLVCRYHAWSYWLNGDLAHAPGSDGEAGFPKDELGLVPVSVETFGPAIVVNADPNARSFLDSHAGYAEAAERIGITMDPAAYSFVRETSHDVASDWKLWYDNFVECYHCDNIHRSSFSAAYDSDIRSVETVFCDTFMSNRFAPKSRTTKTSLRANNYRSLNTYPGLLILQQDDLMILSQMRPAGPETTSQTVHYFAEAGADPQRVEDWIALWERTFTEDGDATAIQQAGLRTGMVERNRLLPAREEAVLFFNRLTVRAYADFLNGPKYQMAVAAE